MDTAYASIPDAVETIESPVLNRVQEELQTPRVLFFAGDAITDLEKRQMAFKEHGGIYLPHIKTLRSTRGMLYKCALTLLPPFRMIPDAKAMLGPNRAALEFQDAFTQTIVRPDGSTVEKEVKGFPVSVPESVKEGVFATKQSDHIVYKKRYAAQDVAMAIKRSAPHGPGGVVEVTALKGATQAEVSEAQLFFFPNWADIKAGKEKLPERMSDIVAHITARKNAIDTDIAPDKQGKYHSIANDMLRSCTEFIRTSNETVRSDANIVQNAVSKGLAGQVIHSTMSEKFLEQTGAQRKEDLISGEVASVGELAKEMREERLAKAKEDEKRLNLEERKQYLAEVQAGFRERDEAEEIRLGMKQAAATASVPYVSNSVEPIPAVTTTPSVAPTVHVDGVQVDGEEVVGVIPMTVGIEARVCGKPTAAGTACERPLKDDEEACFQHK